MATFDQPSQPLIDKRQAAFGRLVARIIDTLNDAVDRRVGQGASKADLARKIGCERSVLSRVLNGGAPNITLKTISDILWAADHEPRDFGADAIEEILALKSASMGVATEPSVTKSTGPVYRINAVLDCDDLHDWMSKTRVIDQKEATFSQ